MSSPCLQWAFSATSITYDKQCSGSRRKKHEFLGSKLSNAWMPLVAPFSNLPGANLHKWTLSAASPSTASRTPKANTAYHRMADCLVFPHKPLRPTKPKALIHFIGGAFIGAVPEATYRLFIELLRKERFLVVATPYNVTFEHAVAAQEVHQKFQNCRAALVNHGLWSAGLSPEDIEQLPVFSIGHSNGALLQLLMGCIFEENLPKANAVIAFNNKPAADAVPYFEQLGPITMQLNSTFTVQSILDVSKGFPGDYLERLIQAAAPIIPVYDEESLQSFKRFTEQLSSVIDQINRGISEFTPPPLENRKMIGAKYKVQDTLLVKYKTDMIDETDIVEEVLRSRIEETSCSFTKLTLNGNHITPCVQDLSWKAGKVYTPADAVGQVFRAFALSEIRETVTQISNWFEMRLGS